MPQRRKPQTPKKNAPDISVILPCLNEAETLEDCIRDAKKWIGKKNGEVIVVDNGSTDHSVKIARRAGARVIHERQRGYGAAIFRGLISAKGKFLFIADADRSYDLRHLTPFLYSLKKGADLVIGDRFAGGIEAGAMPWLHRYIGNPLLTRTANLFFGTSLNDYHCGVRAVRKEVVQALHLQCVGMEFASEMIVRASLLQLRIDEVPAPYRKDGRSRKSHIRTFRDGWRHLRFLMLFAPNWVFFFPSLVILAMSLLLLLWMLSDSIHLGKVSLGIHTMLAAGAALIVGYQLFHWSLCVAVFAERMKLPLRSLPKVKTHDLLHLEVMMAIGAAVLAVGILFCVWTLRLWLSVDFGNLDPESTMRVFIPGIVCSVLGVQIIFSSLFLGLLNFERMQKDPS